MSAGDTLIWITFGAAAVLVLAVVAHTWPRSGGSGRQSFGSPTSFTASSMPTLYGSAKNGVLRGEDHPVLTKLWDNEEDEAAYG